MVAPRNALVNIAPVTKFYLASFDSSVGTVINTSTISNQVARIDFTENPGPFGATVTQGPDGFFHVVYYNESKDLAEAVKSKQEKSSHAAMDTEIKRTL